MEPENHASPLSEASKKRLIEDTEDWHPRTGTSQSRSFRILAQLTGTENGVYQPQRPLRRVDDAGLILLRLITYSMFDCQTVSSAVDFRSFMSPSTRALKIFIQRRSV